MFSKKNTYKDYGNPILNVELFTKYSSLRRQIFIGNAPLWKSNAERSTLEISSSSTIKFFIENASLDIVNYNTAQQTDIRSLKKLHNIHIHVRISY